MWAVNITCIRFAYKVKLYMHMNVHTLTYRCMHVHACASLCMSVRTCACIRRKGRSSVWHFQQATGSRQCRCQPSWCLQICLQDILRRSVSCAETPDLTPLQLSPSGTCFWNRGIIWSVSGTEIITKLLNIDTVHVRRILTTPFWGHVLTF